MPSAIRIASGLVLGLVLAGCSASGPRDLDDLVAESRKAYEILEPEVRRATERILEEYRQEGARFGGQPAATARIEKTWKGVYESADGKDRKTLVLKTYLLKAEEQIVQYEVRTIPFIAVRASGQVPFEARIDLLVTEATREKEARLTVPPIPPGYKKSAFASEEEVAAVVRVVPIRRALALPWALPLSLHPADLPGDLPDEARAAVSALKEECLRTPSTITRRSFAVTLIYSAGEKRWMPAGNAQKQ